MKCKNKKAVWRRVWSTRLGGGGNESWKRWLFHFGRATEYLQKSREEEGIVLNGLAEEETSLVTWWCRVIESPTSSRQARHHHVKIRSVIKFRFLIHCYLLVTSFINASVMPKHAHTKSNFSTIDKKTMKQIENAHFWRKRKRYLAKN